MSKPEADTWPETVHDRLADARSYIEVLERKLREAEAALMAVLENRPQPNGEYLHAIYCSGSRRRPPTERGHSCCCPIGKSTREAEARLAKVVEAATHHCRTDVASKDHSDCFWTLPYEVLAAAQPKEGK